MPMLIGQVKTALANDDDDANDNDEWPGENYHPPLTFVNPSSFFKLRCIWSHFCWKSSAMKSSTCYKYVSFVHTIVKVQFGANRHLIVDRRSPTTLSEQCE